MRRSTGDFEETVGAFRVATWNLWWQFGAWQQRAWAIRETLRQLRPDVCGLQEIWGNEETSLAAALAADLDMHLAWTSSPDSERWRTRLTGSFFDAGQAILARWPISAVSEVALPRGDSGDRSRSVLTGVIEAPQGRIPVATTQLTKAPWDSATRCLQVRALARLLSAHDDEEFPPVVLADLNAEPDSDEVRLLCGHKTAPATAGLVLVDAWRYADAGSTEWTWDRANPHVRETMEPSARIDYVLVGVPREEGRGHILSVRRIGAAPVGGIWPSDHAGVMAELAAAPG